MSPGTQDLNSDRETDSIVPSTLDKMSDHELQNASGKFVTSEDLVGHNKKPNSLFWQLKRLCELMRELKGEQSGRRHEQTTSFRATSSSSGSRHRSDHGFVILPTYTHLHTLLPKSFGRVYTQKC